MTMRSESGFTLIELIVATTLGMIVMLAGYMLLDRGFIHASEVAQRTDTNQRGRNAMRQIVQQLRSQVCLGVPTRPIVSGNDNAVTFYSDMSEDVSPERRSLTYDPNDQTIEQTVIPGGGAYPSLTFDVAETKTTRLLDKVGRVPGASGDVPFFRYYGYNNSGPGAVQALTTPLSSTDRARVVLIKVSYVANPLRTNGSARRSTTFQDDVYVRSANQTPNGGPRCI
jgi:prepilin-type N-terminal cleavage/methylation domain-containing protein